ncbi:hypothetical protein SLE2022_023360 [Rubroshorea leprosula]
MGLSCGTQRGGKRRLIGLAVCGGYAMGCLQQILMAWREGEWRLTTVLILLATTNVRWRLPMDWIGSVSGIFRFDMIPKNQLNAN